VFEKAAFKKHTLISILLLEPKLFIEKQGEKLRYQDHRYKVSWPMKDQFSMKCTTEHLLLVKYQGVCTLAERSLENNIRFKFDISAT